MNTVKSMPVVSPYKKECVLFLFEKNTINCLRFNAFFELTDNIADNFSNAKQENPLGYSTDSSAYYIFFSNKDKNEFNFKSFDFESKQFVMNPFAMKIQKESFVESFSTNNRFYILTVKKNSSLLKLYSFEGKKMLPTKSFDFTGVSFNTSYENQKLSSVLLEDNNFASELKPKYIHNSIPLPVYFTCSNKKIFLNNNKIYILLDNETIDSKIITLSTDENKYNIESYKQLKVKYGMNDYVTSNSFIADNKLFQVKCSGTELAVRISEVNTKNVLKEFRVQNDEDLNFATSEVIQDGGLMVFTANESKVLESTKKILKRLSAGSLSISALKNNNNYELTIGAFKTYTSGGGGGGFMPGFLNLPNGSGGTVSVPTYSYNPTLYGISSSSNSRTIYFQSVLNSTSFEPLKEKKNTTVFEKIIDFKKDKESHIQAETLFMISDFYVYGYYDPRDKVYYLRKFSEK